MNIKGKTHPSYDKEFREQAVEMLLECGRPLREVARELGISDTSLRAWKKKYLGEVAEKPEGKKYTPEYLTEEIERLRKENEYLKRQRTILKKACGILSDESQKGMP